MACTMRHQLEDRHLVTPTTGWSRGARARCPIQLYTWGDIEAFFVHHHLETPSLVAVGARLLAAPELAAYHFGLGRDRKEDCENQALPETPRRILL